MKVTRVYPGSVAEKAGLRDGDVIRSANGYATEGPGNLTWILSNAAPNGVLRMTVRSASDGHVRTITTQRP
jgi:S1-C subfamily serine protease